VTTAARPRGLFGEVGNPDHDDCVRILHAALGSGITRWRPPALQHPALGAWLERTVKPKWVV
jgi:hypothetical protein